MVVYTFCVHAKTKFAAAREKINEEFRKNSSVSDEGAIKEVGTVFLNKYSLQSLVFYFEIIIFQLIDFANAVEHEMRTTIIQTVEVAPGRFGRSLDLC